MPSDDYLPGLAATVEDFRRARRRAAMESLLARMTGRPTELFDYAEVSRLLRGRELPERRREQIPLAAIVGSVGRYREFTRSFLPRDDHLQKRWAKVKTAVAGLSGLPPIEVYRIGDYYFVSDGNHRVSVAREMGLTSIEAYVTPVTTKVPFEPTDSPDDLILKAELAGFLEHTRIDRILPEADIRVTAPGKYPLLEEHITVHRHFMGLEWQREIPWEEAVVHWYREVYLPVVELIRRRGILRDFPERTEADLYLWVSRYHAELEESLGWTLSRATALADLAREYGRSGKTVDKRRRRRRLSPVAATEASDAGAAESGRPADSEFQDILVLVQGERDAWRALDQALVFATAEAAAIGGLYVGEDIETAAGGLRPAFEQRCRAHGIESRLALETGSTVEAIVQRARWTDLVVVGRREEEGESATRWGFVSRLVQSCPRPLLWVPRCRPRMDSLLLAYDGGAKSIEALYLAAYIANRFSSQLRVFTSAGGRSGAETQDRAKRYLEAQGIAASFYREKADVAGMLGLLADEHDADLILAGGSAPRGPALFGSSTPNLRKLILQGERPLLICT